MLWEHELVFAKPTPCYVGKSSLPGARLHVPVPSLLFLLVAERLERARCTTARETGVGEVDGRAENGEEGITSSPFSAWPCLSLTPVSQLQFSPGPIRSAPRRIHNTSRLTCWSWNQFAPLHSVVLNSPAPCPGGGSEISANRSARRWMKKSRSGIARGKVKSPRKLDDLCDRPLGKPD